jgi:peroxiredoxin
MPMLESLYKEFEGKGLKLVAISTDAPGTEYAIRDFVTRYGLTFDVLHDSEGGIMRDYMTTGLPETFLIAKDGVIRFKQIGPVDEIDAKQIRALLDQLLAEPAG